MSRANIQLLAVGPSRDGRVSRWSSDLSLLKSSSICQRNRYRPMMPRAGSEEVSRVVRIQITSPARVRAAIARAGIQATAFSNFQTLWLFVAVGGTGILIAYSTSPTDGILASFSAR